MDMLMGACSYFVVKSVIFITAHCILKTVHVFFFFKEFLKKNIKSLIFTEKAARNVIFESEKRNDSLY